MTETWEIRPLKLPPQGWYSLRGILPCLQAFPPSAYRRPHISLAPRIFSPPPVCLPRFSARWLNKQLTSQAATMRLPFGTYYVGALQDF